MPTRVLKVDTFPLTYTGGPAKPFAMVADNSGNLWVDGAINLYQVRTSDGAQLGTTTPSNDPFVVYLAFDGTRVWMMGNSASPPSNSLVYVFTNGALTSTYSVGVATSIQPFYVTFDRINNVMWILSTPTSPNTQAVLTKMNMSGTIVASLTMPAGQPVSAAILIFDGVSVWFPIGFGGTLYQVNAAACTLTNSFPISNYTANGVLTGGAFDGTAIWYSDSTSNILKISTAGALIASYPQTVTPFGVTFDGTNIWYVGIDNARTVGIVSVLDPATGIVLVPPYTIDAFIPGSSGPLQIYSDGRGLVWVTTEENTLVRASFASLLTPNLIIDPVTIPVHHLPFCHRKECIFS